MEEIIKQSFNYARIKIFKNYSNTQIKKRQFIGQINHTDIEASEKLEASIFDSLPKPFKSFTITAKKTEGYYLAILYGKDNKNQYFYTKNPTETFRNHAIESAPIIKCETIQAVESTPIKGSSTQDGFFETTKDRHIKEHYGNPFASIGIFKIERWIKVDGDKITMKYYYGLKTRSFNKKFFKKITKSTTITFNTRTGNFTSITYHRGPKATVKHFYCNSFSSLKTSLDAIYNPGQEINRNSILYYDFVSEFNHNDFQLAMLKAFKYPISDSFEPLSTTNVDAMIAEFMIHWRIKFIEFKKIKCPDNGKIRLLDHFYPTERYLKKNDRKLVASVLDMFGIKSNITIKILHKFPYIDMLDLVNLCHLLGENYPKYIGNISDHYFLSNDNGNDGVINSNDHGCKIRLLDPRQEYRDSIRGMEISNNERENIIKIINDSCERSSTVTLIIVNTFIDHFRIIERIRPYYPDSCLHATTRETFNAEHSQYSQYERTIKKGYSINLIFENYIIDEIQKPIEIHELLEPPIWFCKNAAEAKEYERKYSSKEYMEVQHKVFSPKLLKTSEEYDEEGEFMHHCIAGYVNHDRSIIVSLRSKNDRLTCEFDIKTRKCRQSQFLLREEPPALFKSALEVLKERIKNIRAPISPIDKIKVPFVINGITVSSLPEVVYDPFEV